MNQNITYNNIFMVFLYFCIIFVIIFSEKCSCVDYYYETCLTRNCGHGPNISYPFFISSLQQPNFCGYKGFELNCSSNGYPMLKIRENEYVIENIFYQNNSFRVYNSAIDDQGLRNGCLPEMKNISFGSTPFHFMDVSYLYLLSDCNNSLPGELQKYKIGCDGREEYAMFAENENLEYALGECNETMVAPIDHVFEGDGNGVVVRYQELMRRGFVLNWTASDCSECRDSGGRCGFNESNYHFSCYCPDRPHSASCKPEKRNVEVIIGSVSAGVAFILLISAVIFTMWRRKKKSIISKHLLSRNTSSDPSSRTDVEAGSVYHGVPVFSYTELEEVTNNFDSSKELGDGGFGVVYYGKLRDGREVAVKRLYEHNYKRVQQFMNEIKILTCLKHPNLVTLYGCTSRRSRELLLVYEYVPNGTVADHLHGDREKYELLSWPMRMNIAIETASALTYLHASDIIHRDIKTNNILLDHNFSVKVADFGLSRLFPNDVTHVSTAPQGTPGYVDPEYHECYQLTDKSDVYSFGVVLVELISSMQAVDITRHRHEINLANLAINRIQRCAFDELIDSSLGYKSDPEVKRMTMLIAELAFRCLQLDKELRPTMDEVLETLLDIKKSKEDSKDDKIKKIPHSPETDDDAVLLKNIKLPPPSPNTVTEVWNSSSSTIDGNG